MSERERGREGEGGRERERERERGRERRRCAGHLPLDLVREGGAEPPLLVCVRAHARASADAFVQKARAGLHTCARACVDPLLWKADPPLMDVMCLRACARSWDVLARLRACLRA